MRLVVAALVVALACPSGIAFADFVDGQRAMQRGDAATAIKEFLPLAENGDVASQYELGNLYFLGRGTPKDAVAARRWWTAAAEQGHAGAQFALGVAYELGEGGPRDTAVARSWYEKSATQQYGLARRSLALLAVTEANRRGDYQAAFREAQPLAEAGDPALQTVLALMHRDGKGTPIDKAAFVRLIEAAAAQNFPQALVVVGNLYETGDGRPADLVKAREYFAKAAALNFEPARQALARIGGPRAPSQTAVAPSPPSPPVPPPPAQAQPPAAPRPVLAEGLMFRPPANFKVAARSQQGNRTTTEYTPVAESAENWSEMLTLIAINGLRDTKPETMVDQIAKQWYGVCANMANVLPRVGSEGGYPFAEANFECVDPKPSPSAPRAQLKKYERMMMKVIQGRDGLYIMQRAWHSDTDPRPKGVAGVDPDTEWKAFFAGVEVCDSRVPGRLPCPAVTTPPASPAPAVAAAPARPNPGQAPAPAAPSSGTGFVVNKAGFVVTNNHVVDKCQTIQARQPSDTPVSATLVAADPRNDLALLKLAQPKYGAAPFRQDRAVRPGDSVVAYGFPLAGGLSSQGNLTIGTISALAGLGDDSRMLQVTVPVQPGNSGGPLLDAAGNIVGVVTSKLNALAVALVTGDVPQNVNFAIKDSVVRTFLESNGIAFETAASARRLDPADVGDRAKKFTVQIECRR